VTASLPEPGSSERTRVRRLPELAVHDLAAVHHVLDLALVAHVALVHQDQPYAVPVAFARAGNHVLLHGSTGSRLFRELHDGAWACVTVTVLDGLVLARSVFESSMNYRSVMVLGRCTTLANGEKMAALQCLTEHLLPGRWAEARQPSSKELAATSVLAMPLNIYRYALRAARRSRQLTPLTVSRIAHPCGNLHRTRLTGHSSRQTPTDLQRSRRGVGYRTAVPAALRLPGRHRRASWRRLREAAAPPIEDRPSGRSAAAGLR